jgi:hypothetical protein
MENQEKRKKDRKQKEIVKESLAIQFLLKLDSDSKIIFKVCK